MKISGPDVLMRRLHEITTLCKLNCLVFRSSF